MYLVYSFCVAKTFFVVEVSGSEALKLAPIYVRICRAEMHVFCDASSRHPASPYVDCAFVAPYQNVL